MWERIRVCRNMQEGAIACMHSRAQMTLRGKMSIFAPQYVFDSCVYIALTLEESLDLLGESIMSHYVAADDRASTTVLLISLPPTPLVSSQV